MRRRRRGADSSPLVLREGETPEEWRRRLLDEPTWLHAKAAELTDHPSVLSKRRRKYLLDRAAAIEAGQTPRYRPYDEFCLRAV